MTSYYYCPCETAPLNVPSAADPYQPAEALIPHPLCPTHGWSEGDPWDLWDERGAHYDLALTFSGEWIDADDWDPETGERKPE